MVGTRIRELRSARGLSLSEVAHQASISAATLSRIETGKQNIDVGLMTLIAKVLHVSPHDFLEKQGQDEQNLVERIATLQPNDRARIWREAGSRRKRDKQTRGYEEIASQLEEVLAQIDFLRTEVERLCIGLRTQRRK